MYLVPIQEVGTRWLVTLQPSVQTALAPQPLQRVRSEGSAGAWFGWPPTGSGAGRTRASPRHRDPPCMDAFSIPTASARRRDVARLAGARALPRAVREPVRRARAVADPERRRRRLRSVDRNCRSAPDRGGAARGGRCAPRRTLARAVLAAGSAGRGERARGARLGRERGRAVVRHARARSGAAVGRDLDAAHRRDRRVGGLEHARVQDAGRRIDVRRAARSVDRRDAADRRRGRGRLAARVPRPAAPRGAARRARRRRTARRTHRWRAPERRCAAFSAARRRAAGRSASCSRRPRGRERSSTPARS